MELILITILLLAHAPIVVRFARKLRAGMYPDVSEFAGLAIVLYIDFGLLVELLGVLEWTHPRLPSFFEQPLGLQMLTLLIAIAAPHVLYVSARWVDPSPEGLPQVQRAGMHPDRKLLFYGLVLTASIGLGVWGLHFYLSNPVGTRDQLRSLGLGPLYIVVFFPMYFLGFYLRQQDAASRVGRVVAWLLLVCAVLAPLPVAGRSGLLLPVVMFLLFRGRLSLTRMGVFGLVGITLAVVLVPLYYERGRWGRDTSLEEVAWDTPMKKVVFQDLSRASLLADVIDRSPAIGTQTMPYPFAGYVHAFLLYVPREIAPFKQKSSAILYSAHYFGVDPDHPRIWGFGHGMLNEMVMNAGLLYVIVLLPLYGVAMGLLNRLSRRYPALLIPTRLGAFWHGGYVLSVVFTAFGTMLIVGLALQFFFGARPRRQGVSLAGSLRPAAAAR
jgi:hypothetical protein